MITKRYNEILRDLKNGKVVGLPTETVYGLGAGIYFESAINEIYQLKKRPKSNPLIVHVSSIEMIRELTLEIPESIEILIKKFTPGPISFLLKKNPAKVPNYITSNSDYVVVRIPNHPIFFKLIEQFKMPIAAPSANPYQMISPTSALHVNKYFENKIKIFDGGTCKNGIESTIISPLDGEVVILRKGAISKLQIEKVLNGKFKVVEKESENVPGSDKKHYAPNTPFLVVNNIDEIQHFIQNKKVGIIAMKTPRIDAEILSNIKLYKLNSTKEAMVDLYAVMHFLDELNLDVIYCERFPDDEYGQILNEKIEKAVNI